jgi:hypothetical protein
MSPALAPIPAIRAGAWTRTAAVDFFRGLGLWMVFADHMNPNIWSLFTLWRFGFSDFAEMFVYLSGFIGIGAYQRALESGDTGAVLKKLIRRIGRLYVAHILSLAISMIALGICARYGVRVSPEWGLYMWMEDPLRYALRALTLTYAPAMFSLLPLYISVCPILVLASIGLRRAPKLTLSISAGLWLINQIPFLDSRLTISAWMLHPAAWQFLFVLGACTRYYSDRLQKFALSRPMVGAATAIVAGAAVLKVLALHRVGVLFPSILPPIPDLSAGKEHLAFFRLLHFLSLAVIVHAWTQRHPLQLRSWLARMAVLCGTDSLFVYSSSLVLAIGVNLLLAVTHGGVLMQTQLCIYGLTLLCGMAWLRKGTGLARSRLKNPLSSEVAGI